MLKTKAELIEEIRGIYLRFNAEDSLAHERFMDIYWVLTRYQGKQITKRFKTALEKEHPTWRVWLEHMSTTTYIRVWGGNSGYKASTDACSFLVGYSNELASFDIAKFEEHNKYYAKTVMQKVAERNIILGNTGWLEETAERIIQFDKTRRELQEWLMGLSDQSAIKKLIDMD